MGASGAESSSLRVGRFRARYFVASDHPAPERVREKLDDVVFKDLAAALDRRLAAECDGGRRGVWFIRRLALSLDVNVSWDAARIAGAWAEQLARALAAPLAGAAAGEDVVRFDDRAAYLASFLSDLAAERAWGRWFYEEFDGLRMLPTSAALRTAVCTDPAVGLEALRRLPPAELSHVARALGPQDARRAVAALAGLGAAGEEARCFEGLWAVWDGAQLGPAEADEEWRNVLRLYVAAWREAAVGGDALTAAARALLRLARLLTGASPARARRLLRVCAGPNVAALYATLGAADAEVLLPLTRCPPELLREVGRTFRARYASGEVAGQAPAEADEPRHTPFGGLFLLLPFIDELRLEELTRGWPDAAGTKAEAAVRLLLLAKCVGRERAERLFFDPLARDLAAVTPALTTSELGRWRRRLRPAWLEAFGEGVAARRRENATRPAPSLAFVRAAFPGRAAGVVVDVERAEWIYARALRPGHAASFIHALPETLNSFVEAADLLLCEEEFEPGLRRAFPAARVVTLGGEEARGLAEQESPLAEFQLRLGRLGEDAAYLALPRRFGLAGHFDLALSVAAQGVLRAFSRRLPGFASSGLPYLFRNFLDFAAGFEEEAARRVVRVGRPPLGLVLGITGMCRQSYRLGWLGERPLVLFEEG